MTDELDQSFQGDLVSAAGSDELKLRLTYALQGVYTDIGVGRDIGITRDQGADYRRLRNDRGQLHRHVCKQKRWHSKQMDFEGKRLAEPVSELYGKTMIASVAAAAPAKALLLSCKRRGCRC